MTQNVSRGIREITSRKSPRRSSRRSSRRTSRRSSRRTSRRSSRRTSRRRSRRSSSRRSRRSPRSAGVRSHSVRYRASNSTFMSRLDASEMHEITIAVMQSLVQLYQDDYDGLSESVLKESVQTRFVDDAKWLNAQVGKCLSLTDDVQMVRDILLDAIYDRSVFDNQSEFENMLMMMLKTPQTEPTPTTREGIRDQPLLSTPRERVNWEGGVGPDDERGERMYRTFSESVRLACYHGVNDIRNKEDQARSVVVLRGTGSGIGEASLLKRIGWTSYHVVSIDPFNEPTAHFETKTFHHFKNYDHAISHMQSQRMIPVVVLALNYGTITPLIEVDGKEVESDEYKIAERNLFQYCFDANARCRYAMAYFDRYKRLYDRYCFVAEHIQRTYISVDPANKVNVPPDGDCMFQCVARCTGGDPITQVGTNAMRLRVSGFIRRNWMTYYDKLKEVLPKESIMVQHARTVEARGQFGTIVDLFALANTESCIINVFLHSADGVRFLDTFVPEEPKLEYRSCTLLYDAISEIEAGHEDGGGHYDLIVSTTYKEFPSRTYHL